MTMKPKQRTGLISSESVNIIIAGNTIKEIPIQKAKACFKIVLSVRMGLFGVEIRHFFKVQNRLLESLPRKLTFDFTAV